ncbi:MAG TPA: glycosyltransferase family A protein [Pyrinomonadaceae bacterium]|nr:glycosyltransferase family A protein [Pyrinomonadaceae bacterium]
MKSIFSVVIPTYNRAYVLWRAVQSVVSQTESSWELIVVNDGSTDCTLRLLEEFQDERIRIVTTPNQGQSAARNYGVKIAQSPFIAYLDSDNSWHPNFLETMREAIEQNKDCVLWYCGQNYTCWERIANGEWFLISQETEPRKQYTAEEIWRLKSADTNCLVHRREILETVGGWDEQCRWLEDWDFFLRVFLKFPNKMKWIPQILVEYRQVFGTGADGVCAEARENVEAEIRNRRYLLEKWKHYPDFAAFKSLEKNAEDLLLMRAYL